MQKTGIRDDFENLLGQLYDLIGYGNHTSVSLRAIYFCRFISIVNMERANIMRLLNVFAASIEWRCYKRGPAVSCFGKWLTNMPQYFACKRIFDCNYG